MFNLTFTNVDEYNDYANKYITDICPVCSKKIEVILDTLNVNIDGKNMNISEVPILKCVDCEALFLSHYIKGIIRGLYKHLIENKFTSVESTPSDYHKKFVYANECDYIYDHRDYESIPGLCIDYENGEKGFLQPVYFKREALIFFIHSSEYEVDLFSETYGDLRKKSFDGYWQYEWDATFGINVNGKLVFWLGDIDGMDNTAQRVLKAFNIESDHQLTRSEFYDAQLNAIFSDPIKEQQIIQHKEKFYKLIREKYGYDLTHLADETDIHVRNITRPVPYTLQSIEPVINAFHKILVEGVNLTEFRNLYSALCANPASNYREWKSIKLYQFMVEHFIAPKDSTLNAREVIAPLYLLNDLRILFDHLVSQSEQNQIKQNIIDSLGLDDFSDIERLYHMLIDRLGSLFQLLALYV